jgi:hypothetical protein
MAVSVDSLESARHVLKQQVQARQSEGIVAVHGRAQIRVELRLGKWQCEFRRYGNVVESLAADDVGGAIAWLRAWWSSLGKE